MNASDIISKLNKINEENSVEVFVPSNKHLLGLACRYHLLEDTELLYPRFGIIKPLYQVLHLC
jgi:hypothetical protein